MIYMDHAIYVVCRSLMIEIDTLYKSNTNISKILLIYDIDRDGQYEIRDDIGYLYTSLYLPSDVDIINSHKWHTYLNTATVDTDGNLSVIHVDIGTPVDTKQFIQRFIQSYISRTFSHILSIFNTECISKIILCDHIPENTKWIKKSTVLYCDKTTGSYYLHNQSPTSYRDIIVSYMLYGKKYNLNCILLDDNRIEISQTTQ